MRIYVINLDESPGRLSHMERTLGALGLSFERAAAVAGRNLSQPERESFFATRPKAELTSGEIGCFLSHRAVWKTIAEADEEWALILEDDVLLSSRLPAFLEAFEARPPAAGIVKVETRMTRIGLGPRGEDIVPGVALHELRSLHFGSAGYIVNKFAAAHLLQTTVAMEKPVDWLFDPASPAARELKILQAVPALVMQSDRSEGHAPTLESVITVSRRLRPRAGVLRRIVREVLRPGKQLLNRIRLWRNSTIVLRVPMSR